MSQTVYFTNPTVINSIQSSIYDDRANYSALSADPIYNSTTTPNLIPFTYASLATGAQALMNLVWNATNQNFYQSMSANSVNVFSRADWVANQFMSGAAALNG